MKKYFKYFLAAIIAGSGVAGVVGTYTGHPEVTAAAAIAGAAAKQVDAALPTETEITSVE